MAISRKFKHGDLVCFKTNPMYWGKVLTPDKIILPQDNRKWKMLAPSAYLSIEPYVIVKFDNEMETVDEKTLMFLPDAVKVLYGI